MTYIIKQAEKIVSDYEDLLKELADTLLNEEYLLKQNECHKVDCIYKCRGKFRFEEEDDDCSWDY